MRDSKGGRLRRTVRMPRSSSADILDPPTKDNQIKQMIPDSLSAQTGVCVDRQPCHSIAYPGKRGLLRLRLCLVPIESGVDVVRLEFSVFHLQSAVKDVEGAMIVCDHNDARALLVRHLAE